MQGASMNEIEAEFGVPKSTQNSWFSKMTLSKKALNILDLKKEAHLIEARKKAIKWHNSGKAKRMEIVRMTAEESLSHIDAGNKNILELALAMLYLGEGSKTTATGMGNSDPLIVKFFIESIRLLYGIDMARMRFDLHLRADQNPDKMNYGQMNLMFHWINSKRYPWIKERWVKRRMKHTEAYAPWTAEMLRFRESWYILVEPSAKRLREGLGIDKIKRD
jgi:hypothetical protein